MINYLGRVGARIVVVADDGAFGDAIASSVEAGDRDLRAGRHSGGRRLEPRAVRQDQPERAKTASEWPAPAADVRAAPVSGPSVPESPRRRVAVVLSCRGGRLPWWPVAMVPSCRGAELPWCRGAELPSCRVAVVPSCRGAGLPRCRVAEVPSRPGSLGIPVGQLGAETPVVPSPPGCRVALGAGLRCCQVGSVRSTDRHATGDSGPDHDRPGHRAGDCATAPRRREPRRRRVLLVTGEAGIGKTRLLDELAATAGRTAEPGQEALNRRPDPWSSPGGQSPAAAPTVHCPRPSPPCCARCPPTGRVSCGRSGRH